MQFNTLIQFRQHVYNSFQRAPDALFEVSDALLTETAAQTFAELSLSPRFRRRWPSLYAAFKDGQIERSALRRTLAQFAPPATPGQFLLLGLDGTGIPRPESATARDRTYLYAHNLPHSTKPVTVGWQFSSLVVLPEPTSSWTYVLDAERIASDTNAGGVGAAQLQAVVPLLTSPACVVADRHYGSAKFVHASAAVPCAKLLRVPRNRVFYRPAPRRTGKRGAPKKDGTPFRCRDARTHGKPTGTWEGCDEHGHKIEVAAWSGLHYKQCRLVKLTVIRVTRHGATGKKRDPRVSWFIWIGAALIPLAQVWPTYRRRYGHEHGLRFDKQDLLWLAPRLRTPERFQRWTDVLGIVRDELVLARSLVEALRQPWDSPTRPATPRQVRRAMGRIVSKLGTPAQRPQLRGKSPGRARGAKIRRARLYGVVYKGKSHARKRKT
jgi:hypothetical protein